MASDRPDEVAELFIRVPPILRKLFRELRAVFEQAGVNIAPHHLMILKVLQEAGPLYMAEVGEESAISKAQMTHSVNKLISLGMVERRPDVRDRRKIVIQLTPQGRDRLERLDEIVKDRMKERLSSIGDDELDQLAVSLKSIIRICSKL